MLREEQNLKDAIEHAEVAVFHGKDGDAKALLEHVEDALQHALKGGTDNPYVEKGISHLKEAIEKEGTALGGPRIQDSCAAYIGSITCTRSSAPCVLRIPP